MSYVLKINNDPVKYIDTNEKNKHKIIVYSSKEEAFEYIVFFFNQNTPYKIDENTYDSDETISYMNIRHKLIRGTIDNIINTPVFQRAYRKVILDTILSPDEVAKLNISDVIKIAIQYGFIASEKDANMLIVESIQQAFMKDDELPLRYYVKDESMPETSKICEIGECLTDEYIENIMSE